MTEPVTAQMVEQGTMQITFITGSIAVDRTEMTIFLLFVTHSSLLIYYATTGAPIIPLVVERGKYPHITGSIPVDWIKGDWPFLFFFTISPTRPQKTGLRI